MPIKTLKKQPLLEPPGERPPLDVGYAEKKDFIEYLEESRRLSRGGDVLMAHFYMRKLGICENITESDRQLMLQDLELARKQRSAAHISDAHRYLRGVGMRQELTDDDKRIITGWITDYGGEGSLEEYTLKAGLISFTPPTPTHKRRLLNQAKRVIEGCRRDGESLDLVDTLHALHTLGMECPIAEGEASVIRKGLESMRETPDWRLGRMLYYLNNMNAQIGKPMEKQDLPPLKKL